MDIYMKPFSWEEMPKEMSCPASNQMGKSARKSLDLWTEELIDGDPKTRGAFKALPFYMETFDVSAFLAMILMPVSISVRKPW